MEVLTTSIGRLHPLVVHLPIGMLILGFIFEIISFHPDYRKTRSAVVPSLIAGGAFSIVAVISGLFLLEEGGYDEEMTGLHQAFGITTTVFTFVVIYVRKKLKLVYADTAKRKKARIALYIPLIILLGATGHIGGSITHGEGFLFPALYGADGEQKLTFDHIKEPEKAILYSDVIEPILEQKCYGCHSSQRQKGKLRLDSPEAITKGGKNGAVVERGVADSSALYARLVLPIEEKEHMPPREKPQLSSSEIDLIHAWISGGADFSKPVSAFQNPSKIVQQIRSLQYIAEASWVPDEKVGEPDGALLDRLTESGMTIIRASRESNYLMVNLTNKTTLDAKDLEALVALKNNVIWLDAGEHQLTNELVRQIGQLSNLRMLYLDNAGVTDDGLVGLSAMDKLRYLNLTGNPVSDAGLIHLRKLKMLRQVFLFETAVTSSGVKSFLDERKDVVIDTGGYYLEKLATDTIVHKRKI